MKRTILLLALGILCPALSSQAFAQPYPNKPIRMIVPFSPGGATDIVARIYAQALQTRVGQSVIVENRVGGNGIIGTDAVARAPADGYTLLFSYPGAITVNPALYEKLSYDPVKDFLPVALLVKYSFILSVNPNVPAKTVKEFIDLAKAQPGKLLYGSAGIGSTAHLTMELFRRDAGVDITHVPFKGSSQIVTELMAGRITASFENTATALTNIRAGTVRALGVSGKERSPLAPEIPTVAEGGLPGYDVTGWYGILVAAGTPSDIVNKLASEFVAITKDPLINKDLLDKGMEPVGTGPDGLKALIADELPKWARLVKEAGIKAPD
jgi:tripartite-type tricarboxylate transporter receptor subunit TctC